MTNNKGLIAFPVLVLVVAVVVAALGGYIFLRTTLSITLLSPLGGEKLCEGEQFLIKWRIVSADESFVVSIILHGEEIEGPGFSIDQVVATHGGDDSRLGSILAGIFGRSGAYTYTWEVGKLISRQANALSVLSKSSQYKIAVSTWTEKNPIRVIDYNEQPFEIVKCLPSLEKTTTVTSELDNAGLQGTKSDVDMSTLDLQNLSPPQQIPRETVIGAYLRGTVIDFYPETHTVTLLRTDGKEEIIAFGNGIADSVENGSFVELEAVDIGYGLYLGNSVKIISNAEPDPIDVIAARKESAPSFPDTGLNIREWIKPATFIFLSPEGDILTPNFTSLPLADYSVDDYDFSQSGNYSNYITIPFMSPGLWGLKVLPTAQADRNLTLMLQYVIDPPKTLAELENKIIYFWVGEKTK